MKYLKATHVYVGRKPVCGCVVSIASYHYRFRKDTAELVAEMIEYGLLVEIVRWSEYDREKHVPMRCPHGKIVADGQQQGVLPLR